MQQRIGGWYAVAIAVLVASATGGAHAPQGAAPPAAPAPTTAPPKPAGAAVIERSLTRYEFQGDGTGRRIFQVRVRVNDAAGVEGFSVLGFNYFGATETCTLRALTVEKADGRVVSLGATAAQEDVTATGQFEEHLYSDLRIKRVTVPALAPGDRLSYDVEIRTREALIPGHFWVTHVIDPTFEVLEDVLEVEAPADREIAVHVIKGDAEPGIAAPAGRRAWRWKIPHTPPPAAGSGDETATKAGDVAVRLASFRSWAELAHWFRAAMDRRAEPDAAIRAKAASLVLGKTTPRDRLTAIFDFVSKEVRYVSLSFGVGRYDPRPAPLVLSTLYGDCKDKHVLLASLARAVGIEVVPVLASIEGTAVDEQVANPHQFDHVISLASAAAVGEPLWLDSTSGLLPPGALLATIRDHVVMQATAAGDSASPLIRPPARLPFPTSVAFAVTQSMDDAGHVKATVSRRIRGDAEFFMRSVLRTVPEAKWIEMAEGMLKNDGLRGKATRAVVEDVPGGGLHVEYDAEYDFDRSAFRKPWTYWLGTPRIDPARLSEAKRTAGTPIELGEPAEVTATASVTIPEGITARAPLPVSISRPFGDYTSTYEVKGRVLSLTRRLVTRERTVPADQFDAYDSLERAADADYRQSFALSALAGADDAVGTSAEALAKAGTKAYETRDFAKAAELLGRATTLDPKHRTAWNDLGRAWLEQRDFDKAVAAFEHQIAVNAFDRFAYNNLGLTRWRQGRFDDAIGLFRKQIEVNPLDRYAHSNLGELLLAQRRHTEAIEALTRAITVNANDRKAWMALGRARLAAAETPLAVEAFDRAASLQPTAADWNAMAWSLVERDAALDRAVEYANRAIDAAAGALRDVSLEAITAPQAMAAGGLSAYWDTLGWIHVKRGELARGEAWLSAAWAVSYDGEIAEHLGVVNERLGRRSRAIERYAQAVAAGREETGNAALRRLTTPANAGARIAAAKSARSRERLLTLGAGPAAAPGTVNLLLDRQGRVVAAHLVSGDESLRAAVARSVGKTLPFSAPDERLDRILVQGQAVCGSDTGCTLVLLPVSATRFVPSR